MSVSVAPIHADLCFFLGLQALCWSDGAPIWAFNPALLLDYLPLASSLGCGLIETMFASRRHKNRRYYNVLSQLSAGR
ncbi:hypothetical protein [Sphingomonas floccifaciens]|uniref:hypothetical protein n=1 Tax=Sphingomonas floccifaciens TaxID=1844115 RepID=UPI0036D288EA